MRNNVGIRWVDRGHHPHSAFDRVVKNSMVLDVVSVVVSGIHEGVNDSDDQNTMLLTPARDLGQQVMKESMWPYTSRSFSPDRVEKSCEATTLIVVSEVVLSLHQHDSSLTVSECVSYSVAHARSHLTLPALHQVI